MIENINDLIYHLETQYNGNKIDNLLEIVNKYSGIDWRKFAVFDKEFYKNVIYLSDNFEIILISWKKNYSTDYHKHPENGCILKVLEGNLLEDIKDKDGKNIMNIRFNNNVSFMHDEKGVHKIMALNDTFSIHIYSPPRFYKS